MVSYRMYREEDDTEDLYNILETYLMQVIASPSLVSFYSSYILFLSYLPLSLPLALSYSVLPPFLDTVVGNLSEHVGTGGYLDN